MLVKSTNQFLQRYIYSDSSMPQSNFVYGKTKPSDFVKINHMDCQFQGILLVIILILINNSMTSTTLHQLILISCNLNDNE